MVHGPAISTAPPTADVVVAAQELGRRYGAGDTAVDAGVTYYYYPGSGGIDSEAKAMKRGPSLSVAASACAWARTMASKSSGSR